MTIDRALPRLRTTVMKPIHRCCRPLPCLIAGLVLALAVTGCTQIVAPLEPFTRTAYPDTILSPLRHDHADREQVRKALGEPRAVKAGGKYWFYTNSREFLGILGGNSSRMLDDYEWVMIEFDAASRVSALEYNDDLNGCLASGICYLAGFLSPQPVITATASASAAASAYQPRADECAIYLYLETLPWFFGNLPVTFSIDGHARGRINDKSYLFLTHPAGAVRIDAYQLEISVPCAGGKRLYVHATKARDWSWETASELAQADATAGSSAIHERRLALADVPDRR
jgi:outer membrane protein assembly factor BamE (lipoprotein component of BamABCDE complex)